MPSLSAYFTQIGARFAPAPVTVNDPKSVATLAIAQRTLSQACKPYADKYAAAVVKLAAEYDALSADTSDDDRAAIEVANIAVLAAIDAKRDESPAVIAARADIVRLTALVATDRARQRIIGFTPLMPDGTTASWVRYTLTPEQLTAYSAETDGEKRTAFLATIDAAPKLHGSVIGITAAMHAAMVPGIYADRDALRAAYSAGTLIVPRDRGDKAGATKKAKRTEAEKAEAALDILFANVPAVESAPPTDPPAAG